MPVGLSCVEYKFCLLLFLCNYIFWQHVDRPVVSSSITISVKKTFCRSYTEISCEYKVECSG